MPLRLEALWIVVESITDRSNGVDDLLAVEAIIRLGDGYRPEAVNYFVERFREPHRIGLWAWHAYLGGESVPRDMIRAAEDSLPSLKGYAWSDRVQEIARAEAKAR
jgi:hypothetical protein